MDESPFACSEAVSCYFGYQCPRNSDLVSSSGSFGYRAPVSVPRLRAVTVASLAVVASADVPQGRGSLARQCVVMIAECLSPLGRCEYWAPEVNSWWPEVLGLPPRFCPGVETARGHDGTPEVGLACCEFTEQVWSRNCRPSPCWPCKRAVSSWETPTPSVERCYSGPGDRKF